MKPFNREKFLLFMLAGIFAWQAALFTFGTIGCFQQGGKEACPNLGDRYENTVGIMVATTLALLGAGAVAGVSQKKAGISESALSLDELPRQRPEQQPQETTSAPQAQGQARGQQAASSAPGPSSPSSPVSPDRASRKG